MVRMAAVRVASFYFGYRILHHEIYEIAHPEPLLIFLGLWMCGIAPATFFDGLRKIGQSAESALTAGAPKTDEPPEPPGQNQRGDSNATSA